MAGPLPHFLLSALFLFCLNQSEDALPDNKARQVGDTIPPPLNYSDARAKIDSSRKSLGTILLRTTLPDQKAVLVKADTLLLKAIGEDLYQLWKGTPWDFNGITQVPRKGAIACGYFVTTLLLHAGYPLNRVKLATCASKEMMISLTSRSDVKNRSTLTLEKFGGEIMRQKNSVFVIGLDFHTGFLVTDDNEAWFIHSNYIDGQGVVKEKLLESAALKASKTRYITQLSGNEKFLRSWLLH